VPVALQVEIYRESSPFELVDVLNARTVPSTLSELRGPGAGSFSISRHDEKILADPTLLDYRNIVRIKLGDRYLGAFFIQHRDADILGEGGAAEEVWRVSGEGLKSWAGGAEVRPYRGLKETSKDTRFFNFATEAGSWYVPSEWPAATQVAKWDPENQPYWGTAPAQWPDAPNAYWIWDRPGSSSMPKGHVFFRRTFNVSEAGSFAFFFAIDGYGDLYVDGELMMSLTTAGWRETNRVDFDLATGPHVIGFRAYNVSGAAGFLGALFRVGDSESATAASLVFDTDSSWRVSGYPASDPGWSVGDVLLALFGEAQARGVDAYTFLAPTFTATHDSAGNLWSARIPWGFNIGASYSEIFSALEETICNIYIDPLTLEVSAWNKRGIDLSLNGASPDAVELAVGKNLRQAVSENVADIRNVLSVRTTDGWREYTNAPSVSLYGRLEASLTVELPAASMPPIVAEYFSQKSQAADSATYEIVPILGAVPFVDFNVGDYVTAPNDLGLKVPRRVMSISVSEDRFSGRPVYVIEFDTISGERIASLEDRLQGSSSVVSGGAVLGGPSSASGGLSPEGGMIPTGTILLWPGSVIPNGWLAVGQAVSRVTYAALFSVIGTTYGAGDGTTTFDLPALMGPISGVSYIIRT
jgi:hypothetical protein